MDIQWRRLEKFPDFPANQIHVWQLFIPDFMKKIDEFWCLLADQEKKRARRFVFPQHHDRFIIVHGVLRNLLGRYLNQNSKDIIFIDNKYGKPEVLNSSIYFNISHSHEMALFAFAGIPVGVDIEYLKENVEYEELADRFFSAAEREQLTNIPTTLYKQAFFNCWTRKEAFIKAIGEGLSFSLNQFDVEVNSNELPLLREVRGGKYNAKDWALVVLPVLPKYVAALAFYAIVNTDNIQCFDYTNNFS